MAQLPRALMSYLALVTGHRFHPISKVVLRNVPRCARQPRAAGSHSLAFSRRGTHIAFYLAETLFRTEPSIAPRPGLRPAQATTRNPPVTTRPNTSERPDPFRVTMLIFA